MRTRSSISIARACAAFLSIFRCRSSTSAICSPIVKAGLRELIGSWKIMAMRSPRSARMRSGGKESRFTPSNRISPPTIRPGGCGTSPMIESAVTLLPHPDSPTMPSVRPASSSKLTPSTARNSPASVAKCVLRFLTSSNFFFDACAVRDAGRTRLRRQTTNERLVALQAFAVEPLELPDRLRMVIDPDIQERIVLGRVDEERRGLLAAFVAAGRFARCERGEQALRERDAPLLFELSRGLTEDGCAR